MPIKTQNVFQWIKSFFDLQKKKSDCCTSFWFVRAICLWNRSSHLVTECLKMCNMYLPFCLLVFKIKGPEDNEMQVFSCLVQSGSKSKLKKLWKLCFVSLKSYSILFPSCVAGEPSILILLVFSLLLPFSWSNGRWILWKWRQMCVLCGSLFNLLSLGQLLTELCMPAFLTGKSQTEHSLWNAMQFHGN